MTDRLPPRDLDAEEAVLGSLLIDPDAIYRVMDSLADSDFYREKHQWTYRACKALANRREAVNQVTVAHELARGQLLEAVGAAPYLSLLISQTPTSAHVEHYAAIVRRMATMRAIIAASDKIADIGYAAPPDADDALTRARSLLDGLSAGGGQAHVTTPSEWAEQALYLYNILREAKTGIGLKSGLPSLDRSTGGFYSGELWHIAARPGIGKSTLLRQIARNMALKQHAKILFVSAEMLQTELTHTMISYFANRLIDEKPKIKLDMNTVRLRMGGYDDMEFEFISGAVEQLAQSRITLFADKEITTGNIQSAALKLKRTHGLDAIFVDYLQILHDREGAHDNARVSRISRNLKKLAGDADVPVICACQVNRENEKIGTKVPRLHELRDSGSLEQDADGVVFLYRADAYPGYTDDKCPPGQAQVTLAKHRAGARLGSIQCVWDARHGEYGELQKPTR